MHRPSSTAVSTSINLDEDQDDDADVLDTPGAERKRWGDIGGVSILATPGPNTASKTAGATRKAGGGKGTTLTLRDQEKVSHCCAWILHGLDADRTST